MLIHTQIQYNCAHTHISCVFSITNCALVWITLKSFAWCVQNFTDWFSYSMFELNALSSHVFVHSFIAYMHNICFYFTVSLFAGLLLFALIDIVVQVDSVLSNAFYECWNCVFLLVFFFSSSENATAKRSCLYFSVPCKQTKRTVYKIIVHFFTYPNENQRVGKKQWMVGRLHYKSIHRLSWTSDHWQNCWRAYVLNSSTI